MGRILNKETCHASAMRFDSRTNFFRGDQLAYQMSRKNGWLDEWFGDKKVRQSSFTREVCYALAKKCKSRNEFHDLSYQGYTISLRNGWINDYIWFIDKPRVLDKETCRASALRFKSRGEFRFGDSAAYYKSLNKGWIKDYTWFLSKFDAKSRAKRKYSDEEIEARARKFTRMIDFERKDNAAYNIAWKRHLLKKFNWLKYNVEAASRNYTDCVYAYEFKRTKTAYIGRTISPKDRDRDHREPGDSVYEYAKTHRVNVPPMKIIAKDFYANEGGQKECYFMEEYRKNGWKLLNKCKGGSLGTIGSGRLTKKFCISIAHKVKYIQDLVTGYPSVYSKLRQTRWLKECTWLEYKRAKKGTYTKPQKEMLAEIASRFKTRREFSNGASQAYRAAMKTGWIDEWFPVLRQPKIVGKFDPVTGKRIETYHSAREAARQNGVSSCSISATCRGLYKTCKGFVYKYISK